MAIVTISHKKIHVEGIHRPPQNRRESHSTKPPQPHDASSSQSMRRGGGLPAHTFSSTTRTLLIETTHTDLAAAATALTLRNVRRAWHDHRASQSCCHAPPPPPVAGTRRAPSGASITHTAPLEGHWRPPNSVDGRPITSRGDRAAAAHPPRRSGASHHMPYHLASDTRRVTTREAPLARTPSARPRHAHIPRRRGVTPSTSRRQDFTPSAAPRPLRAAPAARPAGP